MFCEGPKLPFASGVQQQQTQEMTRFVGAGFVLGTIPRARRGLVQKGALYVLPSIACGPARRNVSSRL